MKKSYIIFLILLVAAIIGLLIWNLSQRQELNEMVEQMTIEKEELQEKQKKSEKASPNEDAAQSPTLAADMDGNAGEFEINDEQTQEYSSSETYPYIIGVVFLLVLIIFIYFVGKERMSGVVGEQKNFNIDSDDNDKDSKKSKIKKITKTILFTIASERIKY